MFGKPIVTSDERLRELAPAKKEAEGAHRVPDDVSRSAASRIASSFIRGFGGFNRVEIELNRRSPRSPLNDVPPATAMRPPLDERLVVT